MEQLYLPDPPLVPMTDLDWAIDTARRVREVFPANFSFYDDMLWRGEDDDVSDYEEKYLVPVGDILLADGWLLWGEGAERIAFRKGDHIIKVQHPYTNAGPDGPMDDNHRERQVWQRVKGTVFEHLFTPLHYSDGPVLVTDYVPPEEPDWEYLYPWLDRVAVELNIDVDDVVARNVHGRKVIDYGYFIIHG